MAPPRTILEKRCAYQKCGHVFRPTTTKRFNDPHACCSRRCATRHQHDKAPRRLGADAMARANRRRAEARVTQEVRDRFGPLSDRERQLFALGEGIGYKRGHNAGYQESGRRV
jgi:hypothetical protein